MGVLVLFFILLLDDEVIGYQNYYQYIIILFALHFGLTAFFRFTLSSRIAYQIKSRKIGFSTILVGSGSRAQIIYEELISAKKSEGHFFKGYVNINGEKTSINGLDKLGSKTDLLTISLSLFTTTLSTI